MSNCAITTYALKHISGLEVANVIFANVFVRIQYKYKYISGFEVANVIFASGPASYPTDLSTKDYGRPSKIEFSPPFRRGT